MKIGLMLPALLMANRHKDRIFAPKELFIWLADELVDHGHEVYVYSASQTQTKAKLISGNKNLELNDYYSIKDLKKPKDTLSALTYIRDQYEYEIELISKGFAHAAKNELDIIHVYSDNFAHYFTKFSKIPTIFTLHDPVFSKNTLEYLRLKMFPEDNYIALSEAQKKFYEELLNFKSVFTVHHGLRCNDFTYREIPERYLIFIGRLLPEKGVEDALKIAINLGIELKIATSSNYLESEYYLKNIKPYLKSKNIKQLPFVQGQEKDQALGLAKAFILPIKWEEPFGMVMLESMACGTPVAAYARGSVPEIIKDGETGFIVNPSDDDIRGSWIIKKTGLEGLSEAVKRIYSMPEEQYEQMRKNCRAHVENNFTVEKMVNNYEKVYEQIVSAKKKM